MVGSFVELVPFLSRKSSRHPLDVDKIEIVAPCPRLKKILLIARSLLTIEVPGATGVKGTALEGENEVSEFYNGGLPW